MCGIAGIFGGSALERSDLVRKMVSRFRHRGPIEDGFFDTEAVTLGMARLSIVDIEGGHQPIFNEDRTIALVFNGQIYNYVELMEELKAKGHVFATRSDTEVIVHLYEEMGPDFLSRLNGMFAIALWDSRMGRLLLARDRLGIKPLYLAMAGAGWVFGSELKSLLLAPDIDRSIDRQAIADYLSLMYVRAPRTPFQGVRKVRPGHMWLIGTDGSAEERRWWDIGTALRPVPMEMDEAADRVLEVLDDAVRIRLRSDVPVGAFLSGGLDSSAVTALMSRHASSPVQTYSVGFAGDHAMDETPFARLVADKYQTRHREITVTADDALRLLPELVWHMDEPHADTSVVPNYLLSHFVASELRVVLSGVGGDELFGGYPRYFDGKPIEHLYRRLPMPLRRMVFGPLLAAASDTLGWRANTANLQQPSRFLRQASIFDTDYAARMAGAPAAPNFDEEWRESAGAGLDPVNRLMQMDMRTYLSDDVLHLTDRMGMSASLEIREPFLDHRFVELAAGLPTALKLNQTSREWKLCLKTAFEDLLPKQILTRPKMGFGSPVDKWMSGRLGQLVRQLYHASPAVEYGLIDGRMVSDYLAEGASYDGIRRSMRLWTLLVLDIWARVFLVGDGERPAFTLSDLDR
ncbi:asparagine synthase (glutamine-hydrolyzing) [Radicibacter daui]|uniref:asparagine synthase (glutamine-hydrolyzing) n=1 Tax=Radicibacter daui TaxID=3064829 RepID=UPI004046E397